MGEIRSMLQEGRYADASSACREALGEAPDSPDLRMLMGLCDEAAGRIDSARAWMEKSLEKDPDHPAAGYHLGRLLLAAGEDERARAVLEQCVAQDPNHAAARTLLARLAQRAGHLDEAVEGLRTALRADDKYAPAHAGLAALLLRKGELDAAHEHASRAIRLRPADAFSQVTMAQVFQAQGHMDFAEQCLRNALEQQPEHPQLRAAMEQLQRVQQSGGDDANTPDSLLARMRSHYRAGRTGPAAEIALALQHRLDRSAPEALELAEVLMDAGQVQASADVLERADSTLPRHGLTRARLAAVSGDMDQALAQLAELFASDQAELRHDARRLAADLHLRSGRMAPALEVLTPLLDESTLPPSTMRMIAQLEHAGGETATARKLLESLLEREELSDGERAVTHNLLGRVLDESGAYAAAARHLVQGGWREPFMVGELDQVSPAELRAAWAGLEAWPHNDQPVDDGRPAPLFVAGWPGSGREALLPALAGLGALQVLVPAELMRRRELLGLPAAPERLASLSESDIRRVRKRYVLGAAEAPAGPLETGLPEATALPAIARFFPGARILWLKASAPALRLHWRLAGCRDIERMVEVWQAEEKLYQHLKPRLPLTFIELETDRLIAEPEAAAGELAEALGLEDPGSLGTALAQALGQAGYREADHWRHYREIL
ncbi:tetratricopeptide repeat protein [Wenzhouxiangella sp. C33]|uniref:Tetratricopeptide repeat protein n=2 Tax=Wenzhouxiangella limi TaxID=2707351 RepID=A0A845UW21_9GAMM|nr:tetratricopeptide repeat protein [Wenzhouxiangella limi]